MKIHFVTEHTTFELTKLGSAALVGFAITGVACFSWKAADVIIDKWDARKRRKSMQEIINK